MIGGNLPALTEVLRLLVPTTELLNRYHESLYCSIGGLAVMANSPPLPGTTAVVVSAGLTLGTERYRYPNDLPKVAAKGRPYCKELGLPNVPPEFRVPAIVADVGANLHHGNQGILLNSAGLKNWLFGPIPGPPRNSAQIGMPG